MECTSKPNDDPVPKIRRNGIPQGKRKQEAHEKWSQSWRSSLIESPELDTKVEQV